MRLKHVLKCLLLKNHTSTSKDCNVALTGIIKLNLVFNILVLKMEYILKALGFIYTYLSHAYIMRKGHFTSCYHPLIINYPSCVLSLVHGKKKIPCAVTFWCNLRNQNMQIDT